MLSIFTPNYRLDRFSLEIHLVLGWIAFAATVNYKFSRVIVRFILKIVEIVFRIITVLLGLVFVFMGIAKFAGAEIGGWIIYLSPILGIVFIAYGITGRDILSPLLGLKNSKPNE